MTTSAVSITMRLRTWALVAGLTALLVAVGAMLGGAMLWLFAGVAVAMNAAGYWFSDRIALRAAGARPLPQAEAPELHAMVADLARRAQIPMPSLHLIEGAQANAFATGRNPEHSAVAVTRGLLEQLEPEQVQGVLAHELAHIRNHDILASSVAAMIAGAISAAVSVLQLSFLFGGAEDEESPLGMLGALAAMILAPLGAMLLQMGISRQREYLADATAAEMLGTGAPLADALATISGESRPALAVAPATAPMYIVNPLSGQALSGLFSTHPPVVERIRRLRAYDASGRRAPRPTLRVTARGA